MSACGSSLRHIFDSTIPENSSSSSSSSSTLVDSHSPWNQIIALKPPVNRSFTEIFGELHRKENSNPVFSSPSSNISKGYSGDQQNDKWGLYHKKSDSLSSLNSESLQICTEGLGSESLDDAEDMKIDLSGPCENYNDNNNYNTCNRNNSSYEMEENMAVREHTGYQYRKGKNNEKTFPPPISCIGKTGKPGVCFQSYRKDGRFVLNETRIPTHEHLHVSREDGRLRLCFFQQSDQDEDDASEVVDGEDNDGEDEEAKKGVVEKINEDEKENDGEGERKEETDEVRDDVERGHS